MSQIGGAIDLRARRTRQQLHVALIGLLGEKRFDAITVNDLAARAMINRATFYRHYRDKNALALDYVMTLLRDLGAVDEPYLAPPQASDPGGPYPPLTRLFLHAQQHAPLYRALLGRYGVPDFAEQLQRQVAAVMRGQLEAQGIDRQRLRMPLEICVHFMATNALTMLVWWLEQGQPYPPEQMATWIPQLSLRGLDFAIGRTR